MWFDIIRLTSTNSYPSDNMTNYLFYKQSECLVKFLIERHPRKMFRMFVAELQRKPDDFKSAFLKVFGKQYKTLENFEKKYRKYAKRQLR